MPFRPNRVRPDTTLYKPNSPLKDRKTVSSVFEADEKESGNNPRFEQVRLHLGDKRYIKSVGDIAETLRLLKFEEHFSEKWRKSVRAIVEIIFKGSHNSLDPERATSNFLEFLSRSYEFHTPYGDGLGPNYDAISILNRLVEKPENHSMYLEALRQICRYPKLVDIVFDGGEWHKPLERLKIILEYDPHNY